MGFDYTFMYPSDEVYVAYTVPYTVTQLNSHIKQLRLLSDESRKFHPYSLCPELPIVHTTQSRLSNVAHFIH